MAAAAAKPLPIEPLPILDRREIDGLEEQKAYENNFVTGGSGLVNIFQGRVRDPTNLAEINAAIADVYSYLPKHPSFATARPGLRAVGRVSDLLSKRCAASISISALEEMVATKGWAKRVSKSGQSYYKCEGKPALWTVRSILETYPRDFTEEERRLFDSYIPICEWERIESFGNGLDCLVHSFLNALCPAYLNLPEYPKKQAGRAFRRFIMPNLPLFRGGGAGGDPPELEAARKRIASVSFLYDFDLIRLCRQYNQRCLVLESARGGQPDQASYNGIPGGRNVETSEKAIVIVNNGLHYESVRAGNGDFLISHDLAMEYFQKLSVGHYQAVKLRCPFSMDPSDQRSKVIYKDLPHHVVDYDLDEDEQCPRIWIATSENYAAYRRSAKRREDRNRLAFEVDSAEVRLIATGGAGRRRTRRRAQRLRRTRKSNSK